MIYCILYTVCLVSMWCSIDRFYNGTSSCNDSSSVQTVTYYSQSGYVQDTQLLQLNKSIHCVNGKLYTARYDESLGSFDEISMTPACSPATIGGESHYSSEYGCDFVSVAPMISFNMSHPLPYPPSYDHSGIVHNTTDYAIMFMMEKNHSDIGRFPDVASRVYGFRLGTCTPVMNDTNGVTGNYTITTYDGK